MADKNQFANVNETNKYNSQSTQLYAWKNMYKTSTSQSSFIRNAKKQHIFCNVFDFDLHKVPTTHNIKIRMIDARKCAKVYYYAIVYAAKNFTIYNN